MKKKIKSLKIISNIKSPYILRYIADGEGKLSFGESPNKTGFFIIHEYAFEFDLFDYINIGPFPKFIQNYYFIKYYKESK